MEVKNIPDHFEAVKEHKPDFVMRSALLTTTLVSMGKTIQELDEYGLRK